MLCVVMCVQAQRKRRTSGSPLVSRPRAKSRSGAIARRMANANRRANASRAANRTSNPRGLSDVGPAPPTEPIDVMDNIEDREY